MPAPELPAERDGAVTAPEQLALDLADHAAGPLREIDGEACLKGGRESGS